MARCVIFLLAALMLLGNAAAQAPEDLLDEDDMMEEDDGMEEEDVLDITTATSSYVGYKGFNYVPSKDMATEVAVQDVGKGLAVASETECAEACDALSTDGCNAASYYGLMPKKEWPAGKNCWTKKIGTACELPDDADDDNPMVILIMKLSGQTCPGADVADDIPALSSDPLSSDVPVTKSPAATSGAANSAMAAAETAPATTPVPSSTTAPATSPAPSNPPTVPPTSGAQAASCTVAVATALVAAACLIV